MHLAVLVYIAIQLSDVVVRHALLVTTGLPANRLQDVVLYISISSHVPYLVSHMFSTSASRDDLVLLLSAGQSTTKKWAVAR